MDSWADEVLAMARRLPREQRLRIADALQKQTDDGEAPAKISDAWKDELVRRVRAFQRGELRAVDGEEVFRRLRAKHG